MTSLKHLKTKKGRDETGQFMVEGEKFIAEIPANYRILYYVVSRKYADTHDISKYRARARCEIIRDSLFDSIASTVTPQGVIAVCEQLPWHINDLLRPDTPTKHVPKEGGGKEPNALIRGVRKTLLAATGITPLEGAEAIGGFILMGEGLSDPGNIGTLIRTAAAAGASGVVLTAGSCDIFSPKVLRAAAGAALRMPVVAEVDTVETLTMLKESQIPIYAAHPRGNALPYDLDLRKEFCLLVGNESQGLSKEAQTMATALIRLPMTSDTESLNASVAGSILLYEAVRQRQLR